jgi:hypothetical protein
MRSTENKKLVQTHVQSSRLFMVIKRRCDLYSVYSLMGMINYECIFGNVIVEGSCFLLSRVISPKFPAGTEKNPN